MSTLQWKASSPLLLHRRGQQASQPPEEDSAMSSAKKPKKRNYALVNPASLDCPICKEALSPPVYQCGNGHIACSSCRGRTEGCPLNSVCTGRIRALAMETVLESVQVSCMHAPWGCKEKLKHFQVKLHETRQCKYADTYLCPVPDCGHDMPMVKMLDHIRNVHGGWTFMALEASTSGVRFSPSIGKRSKKFMVITGATEKEGSSFLVHFEERESLGVLFFCTSIGVSKVFYSLKVKPRDGTASYILETSAPFLQKNGESTCKRQFLLVPTHVDCEKACCKFDVELSFPEAR